MRNDLYKIIFYGILFIVQFILIYTYKEDVSEDMRWLSDRDRARFEHLLMLENNKQMELPDHILVEEGL